VYRVGPAKCKTDYYNGFISPPDHILTGELIAWLAESGVFSTVMDSTAEGEHHFILDGSVTELCGDYSKTGFPKAVVQVRIFLLDDSQANSRVVFQKQYRKEAPLADKTPEALAAGLGAAFKKVLTELTADISRTRLVPGARPTGE
jgi:cholesterol transport system auxiliary component